MANIADILKKLKGPDRELIKAQSEEFETTIGQPRPEEEGLEEGDLTDYSPQGLVKGAIKKVAAKGPRTAAGIAAKSKKRGEAFEALDEMYKGSPLKKPKNEAARKVLIGEKTITIDPDLADAERFESMGKLAKKAEEGKPQDIKSYKEQLEKLRKKRPDFGL